MGSFSQTYIDPEKQNIEKKKKPEKKDSRAVTTYLQYFI